MVELDKIAIALIPPVLLAIGGLHLSVVKKTYTKITKSVNLLHCKHEALVYALQRESKNGFLNYYQEKLGQLVKDEDFVNG